MIKVPKKLIEVALPLDDINVAAAKEKSIRHGHPSMLHLWWARRPLAVARAVIFAQMVNDPGYQQGGGFKYGVNKDQAAFEREKLFDIIREMVRWENTNNETVLDRARDAIKKSWRETCELNKHHSNAAELFDPKKLPEFHDPFAGGGALPLEAQRLGLDSYASDLNPVAVMINKAMIEIPPKFAGQEPVGPVPESDKVDKKRSTKDGLEDWVNTAGLAEDVRRYGHWMRGEAEKRVGHMYRKVAITSEMVGMQPDLKQYEGQDLTVIAWLWSRTVLCPNPACRCYMPLLSSFVLSAKKGKEAYVLPKYSNGKLSFRISDVFDKKLGDAKKGFKRGTSGIFECINCGNVTTRNYTAEQATSVGLGSVQTAVVCDTIGGRIFVSPTASLVSSDIPEVDKSGLTIELSPNPRDVWCRNFGLNTPADLFTARQLVMLTTFSDLVQEARLRAVADAKAAGMPDDRTGIAGGGTGATAYGDALSVYLAFAVNKIADYNSSLVVWSPTRTQIKTTFGRQALPMVWDYAETNPFAGAAGDLVVSVNGIIKTLKTMNTTTHGEAIQKGAQEQRISVGKVVSTDPPYYDNISYADLSDFFYVWMRRSLKNVYKSLFSTMAVPKVDELVVTSYRHDGKDAAEAFFMNGMSEAIRNLAESAHPAFPVSIYYAFKQSETREAGTTSAGWETFLEAVIRAGFAIIGTWPMRTERGARSIGIGTNALASSVILVCQKRSGHAGTISRRQFQRQLRGEMPEALEAMIGGSEGVSPIAPVDLAQAAIGPGMGIYSQYDAVLNQDGTKMAVQDALILINRSITDHLNPDSGSFDNDTLFCDSWFAEYGWSTGEFGQANVLAQGKGTTVDGVRDAGVIESGSGKVRLLKWQEYPSDWDPKQDNRRPVWEALHQLIRALNKEGESGAGEVLARMPERGESIRQLAYHLYTISERKKRTEDARAYNELIASWHAIVAASSEVGQHGTQVQLELDA